MTKLRKISLVAGVLILTVLAGICLLGCILGTKMSSRVPVPDSSMEAIVTGDISGCYSVQLFEHRHPISEVRLLGPYATEKCKLEKVTSVSNIVTIEWSDGYHYSVAIDVNARRFVTTPN